MDELITVIIPVYNRANLFERTVNSVLNQTHKNLEILLIDDNSSIPLSKTYVIKDKRIKIITLDKNYGAQYARNIGIKLAKAEWIAFIDSDDEWIKKKLFLQLQCLKLAGYKAVICDGYYRKDHKLFLLKSCDQFLSGNITKQLLIKPSLMFQGLLVAKKYLEEINYLDEKVPAFHEWDTIIRLSKAFPILIQHQNLFIYNLHNEISITKNIPLRKSGYQYVINKHLDNNSLEYRQHLIRMSQLSVDPYLFGLLQNEDF